MCRIPRNNQAKPGRSSEQKSSQPASEKHTSANSNISTYRCSAHLFDLMLRHNNAGNESRHRFSSGDIHDRTVKKIESVGESAPSYFAGIELSTSQLKAVDVLGMILHECSQSADPRRDDYFAGNKMPLASLQYGHRRDFSIHPTIITSLYEFAKKFCGEKVVAGTHIRTVSEVLKQLSGKNFLFKYTEKDMSGKKAATDLEVEAFAPLIELRPANQESRKLEIRLNPIFRSQIDKKWITCPTNLIARTAEAYGSQKVSRTTLMLRNHLLRALSSNSTDHEILFENLCHIVAEKEMADSRRSKVKKDLEKAVLTLMNMGIIKDYEEVVGATGKPKIVFKLNKEWL
ncbi:MAG TPA: hypothetical protein PLW78_09610 [bacterium]|nr:hypothetical protein [bacterium]